MEFALGNGEMNAIERMRHYNKLPARKAADRARKRALYAESEHIRSAALEKNAIRNYGLTRKEIFNLFEAQGYSCALCGGTDPGSAIGWCVDHDHATKKVRGILCIACNHGLGKLGDCVAGIEAALTYLRNFRVE